MHDVSLRDEDEEKEQEVSEIVFERETSVSVAKRKSKHFLENITLEPVMLFYGIIRSIDSVAQSQLIIDKACLNDFHLGDEICENLLDHDENNTNVQNEVAQYAVYESIVDHVFPVFCSLFLGSWSDNFGRKYLLYIFYVFCMIQTSGLMLNSYFMSWPKEYLLFSVNLPVAISGGHISFSMGIASFIADISSPEQRTFRMASVRFVESLGGPLGTKFGAYLWDVGGYLCVFGTSLLGKLLTLIILAVRLELFKWNPGKVDEKKEERPKKRHVLSPGHIKDSFQTFFKKRSYGKRFYLITYTMVMLTYYLPFFGEGAVSYNYVRTRFHWGVDEYSNYRSICSVIDLVGQAVLIPILGILALPDANIIPFIIFTVFLRHMIKGFAVQSWMMYLGSAVDLLASYSFSAIRSIVTKCVETDEIGKMLALTYSVESLIPIFMTQIYASIWKATSAVPGIGETLWIGSTFFVSASVTTVSFSLALMAWCKLKGKDISELGEKENKSTFKVTIE